MAAADLTAGRAAAPLAPRPPVEAAPAQVAPARWDAVLPLAGDEVHQLVAVRRFGTVGAVLMALGALGAGAEPAPADNPLSGLRLLGLPARMPTVSLTVAYLGMGMVVLAWLWLGRLSRPDRRRTLSIGQLGRTVAMWAVPLVVAPPLFSKDVYSYLAQSAIVARGLDPYLLGPAQALGVNDPLTASIPTLWRNTPAPYGPVFLSLGRAVTGLSQDHVLLGVLLHRVIALAGVALVVWALPRLARRFGVDPLAALWLGAANPLVLFHLVSGVHNDALMLGLMLAGLELGLARSWWLGAAVITLSAAVKVPSALALCFLAVWLARCWGGRPRDVLRAFLAVGGVAVAVMAALSFGSGLGVGWLGALGTPNVVRSWISFTTDLGLLGGLIGILAGAGDHTTAILALTRPAGLLAAVAVCARMLLGMLRGRVELLAGLGVSFGAVVLLGPAVQPWYLLWAALPLAAATESSRYRRLAVALSATLAVLVPPTGADFDFRAYQLPMAIVAAFLVLLVPMVVVRHRIPR